MNNEEQWFLAAFKAQESYWAGEVSIPYKRHGEMIANIKKKLTKVRVRSQIELDHITQNYMGFECSPNRLTSSDNQEMYRVFTDHVLDLSQHCTNGMVGVFQLVIEYAIEMVGQPPCQLDVVALGSIAKGEATPYSDLEFMFLVEKTSDQHLKYFERLAMTIYFLVGNVGETPLKYMGIEELSGWFVDATKNGLKIDGLQAHAGNIPTGNGSRDQHNRFICTPSQLMSRYRDVYDNPDPVKSLKGDLTAMLACTKLLYGNSKLLDEFLFEAWCLNPNAARKKANEAMLQKDLQKFNFLLDASLAQKRRLKKDFYRFPSILILDLKIIHQLRAPATNDILQALESEEVLSSYAAAHLKFLVCSAVYIRLAAYSNYGSQNDEISVLNADPDRGATKNLWYVSRPLLLHMMLHLIPIQRSAKLNQLKQFIEIDNLSQHLAVAMTCHYCGDHEKAEKFYTKSLEMKLRLYGDSDHPDVSASRITNWARCMTPWGSMKRLRSFTPNRWRWS